MKITINDKVSKLPIMKNMKFAAFLIHSACAEERPSLRVLASTFNISKGKAKEFLETLDSLIESGDVKGIAWANEQSKEKKVKQEKTFEERRKDFYNELIPFVAKYGKTMVRSFYNFWVESNNKPKPKMKWELQDTWETSRRLARWSANGKKEQGTEIGRILHNNNDAFEKEIINSNTGW